MIRILFVWLFFHLLGCCSSNCSRGQCSGHCFLLAAPIIQHADIVIGMARVVYGPVLPPEMIWKRNFDSFLQFSTITKVPHPISLPQFQPVFIPEQSWAVALDDSASISGNSHVESTTFSLGSDRRPVVRALFPSQPLTASAPETMLQTSSSALDDQFAFSAQQARKKISRRNITPVVDTSLRRCTRSAAKRDGFKSVLQQLPLSEPRKKKPRAKSLLAINPVVDSVPNAAAPPPSPVHGDTPLGSAPPPTPIRTIQIIGQNLGIPSKKLTIALFYGR